MKDMSEIPYVEIRNESNCGDLVVRLNSLQRQLDHEMNRIDQVAERIEHQQMLDSFPTQIEESAGLPGSDPDDQSGFGLPLRMPATQREEWLQKQQETEWDYLVNGCLILKRGQLTRRRCCVVPGKRYEFVLVEGPKLLYFHPRTKRPVGEIECSPQLRVRLYSPRAFSLHVPGRCRVHLIDHSSNASKWCLKIEQVKQAYYGAMTS